VTTINGMHNNTNNNSNNNNTNNNNHNNVNTGYIVNMFAPTYPTLCQQSDSHENNGHINNAQSRLNQAFSTINNVAQFNSFPIFNNNNSNNNNINSNTNSNNNNNNNNNNNVNNNNDNNNNININLFNMNKLSNTTLENTINKYQELVEAYTRLERNHEEVKNRLAIETKEKSSLMQEINHYQTLIKSNQVISQQKDTQIEELKKLVETLRNQLAKTNSNQNIFNNNDKKK